MSKPMKLKVFKRINRSPVGGLCFTGFSWKSPQTSETSSSLWTPLPLSHLVAVCWNRYFSFFLSLFFLPLFPSLIFQSDYLCQNLAVKKQPIEKQSSESICLSKLSRTLKTWREFTMPSSEPWGQHPARPGAALPAAGWFCHTDSVTVK